MTDGSDRDGAARSAPAPVARAGPEERTDEELVAAHQAGDPVALPALIRRHGAEVRAHARAIVRDVHEAEDVAQEVFLSLTRHLGRWREESRFRFWLSAVTRNTALTVCRRRLQRPAVSVAPSDLVALPGGGDAFAAVDDRLLVDELLHELAPDQRMAVALYDLAGMPYAEVAQELRCPEVTARTRVHRGRRRLRAVADASAIT